MRYLAAAAAVLTSALWAGPAQARSVASERFAVDRTWNAAIRLLRVDFGFAITERDRDAGFILFTYRDAGRESSGSVEIIAAEVEGVHGSRIAVHLGQMPSYAERMILTRLGRKLREEYGEPPTAAPPARPPAEAPARVEAPERRERAPATP